MFATWDDATLITTIRGPGVSGIPFFWYKTAPRVPPVFSQIVMVPVPGLKTLTLCKATCSDQGSCARLMWLLVGLRTSH